MMSSYHIIDEPKVKASEKLIVNPIVILLAAIFLPLFWMPPYFGRWWLPFLWLIFNGYLLGSPTFKKEIIMSIAGLAFMYLLLEGLIFIGQIEPINQFDSFIHYVRIILNAAFFFILYLVVFKQTTPYEIYSYIKKR